MVVVARPRPFTFSRAGPTRAMSDSRELRASVAERKLLVRLPAPLYTALRARAEEENKAMSVVLREALRAELVRV